MLQAKKITANVNSNVQKLRSKWRKVVTGDEKKRIRDLLKETQEKPEYIKLFDKISFTFGVLNICACQYFLLNRPEWFYVWFSLVTPLLLVSRFFHFKRLHYEYFMLDFCYFTNMCIFVNLYLLPNSAWFTHACFILSLGPLCLAILVWRNSLVFHDFDKITSVYIHLLPAMVCTVGRFHGHASCNFALQPSLFSLFPASLSLASVASSVSGLWSVRVVASDCLCSPGSPGALSLMDFVRSLLLYALWQALYFAKTEVLDRRKLDASPHKLTSLRWMAADSKNVLVRACVWVCRALGLLRAGEQFDSRALKTKAVFMSAQMAYTLLCLLPAALLDSREKCLAFIGFVFTVAVFFGASYYIEIFSTRYQGQFSQTRGRPRNKSFSLNKTNNNNNSSSNNNSSTHNLRERTLSKGSKNNNSSFILTEKDENETEKYENGENNGDDENDDYDVDINDIVSDFGLD